MTLTPLLWPEAALTVARTFGVRGAALRAVHEARRTAAAFRAAPRHRPARAAPPADDRASAAFLVRREALAAATDRDRALERADRVARGEFEAYRWTWRRLPATASDWHRHPVTGRAWRADLGWWRTAHIDPAAGDIKDLWEPARFAWAYDLVRGWLVSGDPRYAAAFHQQLAGWSESSPPFRGVHWSCGQETAIRAVALLYAEANLAGAPSSTPEAMARLEAVLAASGERIADAVGYAVSQRNNHAISEAAGLVALGARFRGAHPEAEAWLVQGRRLLERLIGEQFAPDGWYIQHSFNYARLALDQCVIAARALRATGESLSSGAAARLGAALDLLLAVVAPGSGVTPNHGANDGGFVHPATLAGYRDVRPTLTALAATLGRPLPSDIARDAEVLAWLDLPAPDESAPAGDGVRHGESGWAAARIGEIAVFLRAGEYSSRPGHIDSLHLDVRFGDGETLVDAGTFAYNAPAPWRNGLAGAGVHNGPVLDDREPGIRGPRFLWYRWPLAALRRAEIEDGAAVLVAEIPGRVRRTVRVVPGHVTVTDEVLADDARTIRVRWLLHPDAMPEAVVAEGARVVPAREGSPAGWFSPSYGVRLPSRCVEVSGDAAPGRTIVTTIVDTGATAAP